MNDEYESKKLLDIISGKTFCLPVYEVTDLLGDTKQYILSGFQVLSADEYYDAYYNKCILRLREEIK